MTEKQQQPTETRAPLDVVARPDTKPQPPKDEKGKGR